VAEEDEEDEVGGCPSKWCGAKEKVEPSESAGEAMGAFHMLGETAYGEEERNPPPPPDFAALPLT
jgi:hypothetical protein